ncbi:abl-interactor 1 [Loa loa]|uniref:Abl-interactor 1 n=1 Tax=Loa loa TaxID=7209 RepID=A0A1I7VTT7_LOALO|nr:abl-interactor 1 [Loa loa]EFO24129.1 abl-interactor 1 [Loa loa]
MMNDPERAVTLRSLIENEIPDGRANLESSCSNLERVAAYCEASYAQAPDKKAAFDETRRYVVQSLASVAYQVNTLAYALLHALDLQTNKISNMASQVHNVGEIIAIHKEKVARREIGLLTINKCAQRKHKVIAVGVQEPLQRYQRTPIDYSVLDNLGHGVKTPELANRSLVTRVASTPSHGNTSAHYPVFPNFEQLLPKANITATLSRSSTTRGDHYRTPQVATTPIIDPQRFSSVTHGSQNYNGISNTSNYGTISRKRDSQQSVPLPPPQLASVAQYRLSANSLDGLPPPPISVMMDNEPLPPPPMQATMTPIYESALSKNHPTSTNDRSPFLLESPFDRSYDWIPKVYIEKAVALYDYEAEKPDELTLRENCIVYVLRKNEDGWYEGVLNGCTGLFPGNYVETIN